MLLDRITLIYTAKDEVLARDAEHRLERLGFPTTTVAVSLDRATADLIVNTPNHIPSDSAVLALVTDNFLRDDFAVDFVEALSRERVLCALGFPRIQRFPIGLGETYVLEIRHIAELERRLVENAVTQPLLTGRLQASRPAFLGSGVSGARRPALVRAARLKTLGVKQSQRIQGLTVGVFFFLFVAIFFGSMLFTIFSALLQGRLSIPALGGATLAMFAQFGQDIWAGLFNSNLVLLRPNALLEDVNVVAGVIFFVYGAAFAYRLIQTATAYTPSWRTSGVNRKTFDTRSITLILFLMGPFSIIVTLAGYSARGLDFMEDTGTTAQDLILFLFDVLIVFIVTLFYSTFIAAVVIAVRKFLAWLRFQPAAARARTLR